MPQPRHDPASAAERHWGEAASPASEPTLHRRRPQQHQGQDHPIREA
jgi:hypothetical protein